MNKGHPSPAVYDRQVAIFLALLQARWTGMGPGVRILDLGCGDGEMVQTLRQRGYLAWGSDIEVPGNDANGLFLSTDPATGRIGAEDGSFDIVLSNQVLEHVMDLPAVFREIRRVLRPGGVSLHAFPSRWNLVEQHVHVPLAGVFRSRSYLRFWACLGIRNAFQVDQPAARVASLNFSYLREHTNYPSLRDLRTIIAPCFPVHAFIERAFLLSYSRTAEVANWKGLALRIVLALHLEGVYRLFRSRVLWLQG